MTKSEIWTTPPVEHHHPGSCDCEPTIAYLRVSKVGKRDVLISPDIQLDSIYADCKLKDKRVVEIVSDIDKSGRTFRKRSVDRVIANIGRGVAKSVSVWKWSRWGRNIEYSLAYLSLVKDVGGRVDSATEDIDQSTASGRFSRDVIMRVDQLASEQIGEGWQAAHEQRREDGLPHSGRPRFGYTYIGRDAIKAGGAHPGSGDCEMCRKTRPHFLVNEAESLILKDLYARYNAGESLRSLARWLNGLGARTMASGSWTSASVGFMLDTGFAAGLFRERSDEMRARFPDGASIPNSPKYFDIWRKGSHQAVIDADEWETYKARRLAQADLPPRSRNAVHALSTLMVCGLCARRMITRYSGQNRQHQWRCAYADAQHPGQSVSISNAVAIRVVSSWLLAGAKATSDEDPDDVAIRQVNRERGSVRTQQEIEADIKRKLKAIDKLISMNAEDLIGDDQFRISKVEKEQDIRALQEEMATLRKSEAAHGPDQAALAALVKSSGELREVSNAALASLIGMVIVSPTPEPRRKFDAADRVEVVGRWEMSSPTRLAWLEARRIKAFA